MENTKEIGAKFHMPITPELKDKEYLPPLKDLSVVKQSNEITPLKTEEGEIILPGEYNPIYGKKMIEFFADAPMKRSIVEVLTWKNGEVREVEKEIACPPPMVGEFARSIGVRVSKLKMWSKQHPEFADAVSECNEIVKEFIIINGLSGQYPSQFAIFAAKNLTDMKDKQIIENRNIDINKVLDQLEKGNLPGDLQEF